VHQFSAIIKSWYSQNKRDLPWRSTKDPYRIWLSEIILQQTRVDQGLPYYLRFAEKYPTVSQLARAPEGEVMKLWQGLGYYSRARNLHATAKFIAKELRGKFPSSYDGLIKLKGIGQYTAGAIASFAYGEAKPVVDGNVYRILSRYYGIATPIDSTAGKKEFYALAEELLDKKDPGYFNQAIMEFGAVQCKPKSPDCGSCPLVSSCAAFSKRTVGRLPVKEKKTKVTQRYLHYFVVRSKGKLLLHHRQQNDIWKGLYDFPHVETRKRTSPAKLLSAKEVRAILGRDKFHVRLVSPVYRHVLSHQNIFATFFEIEADRFHKNGLYFQVPLKKLKDYAVPRLIENYLETARPRG
jgi:A/G-specific adenine glycosylase